MASREKVEKLMELNGGKDLFKKVSDQYTAPMKQVFEKMTETFGLTEDEVEEMNQEMEESLKKTSEMMGEVMEASIDTMTGVYSEVFTDEEIDRMIEIHSDPVMQKLRENNPYIMQRTMMVVVTKIQEQIEKMMAEEGIDDFNFPI